VIPQHRIEKQAANRAPISVGNKSQLTEDQLAAIKEFVEQLGGIENARRAVAALQELKKAA
jgi:hypothetical protein